MPQQFTSKILKVIEECQDVKTFCIATPSNFTFLPGQFVMLALKENPAHAKAYSIASSQLKKGVIELTIKIEHYPEEEASKHLTPRLGRLKQGQEVIIKGPYGKFTLDETKSSYTFISAGTGIAPLMSMIRYLLDKKSAKQIILINCNKTPETIIYRKELESLKSKIKLIQTISRPEESREKITCCKGRISKELIQKNITKQSIFYICGPTEMVKSTKTCLAKLGIKEELIKIELW